MKQIKIMLTIVLVFAVVGGALAFKAQKFGDKIFCTDQNTTFCNVEQPNYTTEFVPGSNRVEYIRCTDQPVQFQCDFVTIYFRN